jgi:hypothetical protein
MRNTTPKCYLIHIRFNDYTFSPQRTADVGKTIQEMLKHISNDNYETAYLARDGSSAGFFVKTHLPSVAIRSILDGTQWQGDRTAILENGDKFLILELGPDFNGVGFSKAWTWLQHNQNSSTS